MRDKVYQNEEGAHIAAKCCIRENLTASENVHKQHKECTTSASVAALPHTIWPLWSSLHLSLSVSWVYLTFSLWGFLFVCCFLCCDDAQQYRLHGYKRFISMVFSSHLYFVSFSNSKSRMWTLFHHTQSNLSWMNTKHFRWTCETHAYKIIHILFAMLCAMGTKWKRRQHFWATVHDGVHLSNTHTHTQSHRTYTRWKSISLAGCSCSCRVVAIQFVPFDTQNFALYTVLYCEHFFSLKNIILRNISYFARAFRLYNIRLIFGIFSHYSHRLVDYYFSSFKKSSLYLVTLVLSFFISLVHFFFSVFVCWYIRRGPFHVCSIEKYRR